MSRKANIDEFFELAISGIKKFKSGDPISDKEIRDAMTLLVKLQNFAEEFNMELVRYWAIRHELSLDNIYRERKLP